MTAARPAWLRRLERDSVTAGVCLALAAAAMWPDQPRRSLGVLGGVALVAVSYRGILAGLAGLGSSPGVARAAPTGVRGFVKFFTRHAILALGAYVMMARFEFDPMAMLAGVTAPACAGAIEIVRTVRARRRGL